MVLMTVGPTNSARAERWAQFLQFVALAILRSEDRQHFSDGLDTVPEVFRDDLKPVLRHLTRRRAPGDHMP
eukprot:6310580-Alexandrium_andersonii.AAC.1